MEVHSYERNEDPALPIAYPKFCFVRCGNLETHTKTQQRRELDGAECTHERWGKL